MRTTFLLSVVSALVGCGDDNAATTSSSTTSYATTATTTALTTTATTKTTTGQTTTGTGTGTETGTIKTDTVPPAKVCQGRELGTEIGLCGEDFTLLDHTKMPVSLYDYAGDIILLDMSGFN